MRQCTKLFFCQHQGFNNVLASFSNIEAYGGVIQLSDCIKNILICVLKMKESLTGLKQHEGV